jgi:hypothetical protein
VALGFAVGLAAALTLTRLLEHLLYRVHPTDVTAIALAGLVLIACRSSPSTCPAGARRG